MHSSSKMLLAFRSSKTIWKNDVIRSISSKKVFPVIPDNVNCKSDEYFLNQSYSASLINKFESLLKVAHSGGGPKGIARHVERNKKFLATKRIESMLDNKDEFFELSTLAGLSMPYGNIPRAGLITGIGKVQDVYCMFIVNDATVKGGTIYPIALKKQLRAQEIATQNHLPCIFIVDSGGGFLPLQADIFMEGGKAFCNEALASSLAIPQLAIVCGNCTAGGAYVPSMAQEAIIVDKIGSVFLAGPPLVYAALGEMISAEKLGGANLHCRTSGGTDHFAADEDEAFSMGRDIVASFNVNSSLHTSDFDDPLYDQDSILGLISENNQHLMDARQIIGRIVDGSRFQEFKALYGKGLVSGFAFIEGNLVGIIANNGFLDSKSALKGCHFVQLCNERLIPIVFLQNSISNEMENGGMTSNGEYMGDLIKTRSSMISAVACSHVPKFTIIIGNSFGDNNFLMCGRSFNPDFLFSWPNAKISMVNPDMFLDASLKEEILADISSNEIPIDNVQKLQDTLFEKSTSFHISSNVFDDGVIYPQHTRKILASCIKFTRQSSIKRKQAENTVIRM